MHKPAYVYLIAVLFVLGCSEPPTGTPLEAATNDPAQKPRIVGAMRNVMWKGELFARIDFDTLQQWKNLYALGPIEGLRGEFVVFDGRGFRSSVIEGKEAVTETRAIRAPFAGYDYVNEWQVIELPDSVVNLPDIGQWLETHTHPEDQPFFFIVQGEIESAVYHVMNLPEGTVVDSPEVAHELGRNYFTFAGEADLLGFFGLQHKGIFTHHDTFTHIHLLSTDRTALGHLDTLQMMRTGKTIQLPARVRPRP